MVAKQKPASKKAVKVVDAPAKVKNGGDKPVVTVTDAHKVEKPPAQAIEPVVVVEPLSDAEIIRAAWSEVKGAGDPDFDNCVATHKDKYIAHANFILNGSAPQSGDTQLARFEQAVGRLKERK